MRLKNNPKSTNMQPLSIQGNSIKQTPPPAPAQAPPPAPAQAPPPAPAPPSLPSPSAQSPSPSSPQDKKILYMVSDSEGCQENRNTTNNSVTQSSAICSPPFFAEITEKMEKNPNMKFAFLGDYFDQGPKVRQSIEGMMKLYTTFGKERVFIILGNRDVNKLRFMFELNNKLTTLKESDPRWGTWKGYYDGLDVKQADLSSVDHVTHILFTSMGANKDIGLTSFLPDEQSAKAADSAGKVAIAQATKGKVEIELKRDPDSAENKSKLTKAIEELNAAGTELLSHKENAIPYLKASFGIDERKDGMIDVVAFFKMCEICHYDADSKSFLSHGGGWYRDAFFNKAFVNRLIKIGTTNYKTVDETNYLKLMEKYRRALFEGIMDPKYKASTVQESVEAYNQLLQDVLDEVTEKKFTHKFVLLQALGLKPTPEEDSKYRSVIQSCSQSGCTGISPDKFENKVVEIDDNNIDDLFELFQNSDVNFVSYGHKPICYYVPLIYQRTDSKNRKITFISNDTSNGNRPLDKLGNIVMVTSIEESGDKLVAKVDMFGNDAAKRAEISGLHPGLLSESGVIEPPQYEKYADDDGGLYNISYSGGPIFNMNDELSNVGPADAFAPLKIHKTKEEAKTSAAALKVNLANKRAKAAADAAKSGGRRTRGTIKRCRATTRKNKIRRCKSKKRVNRTRVKSRHSRL